MIIEPGALVTFPHKQMAVVGYVDSVEDLGKGTRVANCSGILVCPTQPGTASPPTSFYWRVPVDEDLVVITPPKCRRCSECQGERHHWIEDTAFSCKHCSAVVQTCLDCDGPDEPGHDCGACIACDVENAADREHGDEHTCGRETR